MSKMTMIDNERGIGIISGGSGEGRQVTLADIDIYGETEGDDDRCADRYGFHITQHADQTKSLHITSASALPLDKIKAYGAW